MNQSDLGTSIKSSFNESDKLLANDSNTWNNMVEVLEDKITTFGNQVSSLKKLEKRLNLPAEDHHLSQE